MAFADAPEVGSAEHRGATREADPVRKNDQKSGEVTARPLVKRTKVLICNNTRTYLIFYLFTYSFIAALGVHHRNQTYKGKA